MVKLEIVFQFSSTEFNQMVFQFICFGEIGCCETMALYVADCGISC